jgi:hypothetical protein
MAGQLSPDPGLRRLRLLGGLALAGLLAVSTLALAWLSGVSLSPRVRYVVRPEQPVFGVSVGSPVRVQGVVVGEVAAVRLWQPAAGGRLRPEIALSLDPSRCPGASGLGAEVDRGLRVEFLPVNPASGFLEVNLVWRPGSALERATGDPDELPVLAPSSATVTQAARLLRTLGEADLPTGARLLAERLDASQARLEASGHLAARAARATSGLRAAADELERASSGDARALRQSRLAELREGLRAAAVALEGLSGQLDAAARAVSPEGEAGTPPGP